MDFSSISNTPVASVNGTATVASAADTRVGGAPSGPGGGAFGGVLQSLLPPQERQDVAAPEVLGTPDAAVLTAQTLGMNLQLITAATPVPGEDSLAAFARNQGLNESAIQALFGSAPPISSGKGEAASDVTGAAIATDTPTVLPWDDARALWALGTAPVQPPLAVASPGAFGTAAPIQTTASLATQPASLGAWGTDLTNKTALSLANTLAAQGLSLTPALTAPLSLEEDAPFSIQNLLLGSKEPEPAEVTDEAMAMQLKMSIQPSSLTTRLMNLQGTQVTQPWNQLMTTVQTPNTGVVEELTLEIGPELMQALDERDLELSQSPGQTSDNTLQPTASPAHEASAKTAPASGSSSTSQNPGSPGQQFRADQIQQLADKMGHALADRLQQQIAKGEWSLQLRMNPAKLGQVDVSLDMSAAGLDAIFKTDSALTRELITLGSNRLKDSLTQSGMTVANVLVNSDGGRQAGGNPTQQQKQAPSSQQVAKDTVTPTPVSTPSRIMRADGWDVLA